MSANVPSPNPVPCVYCGEPATTEDHVPPQSLFPDHTVGLIKVPACLNCNNDPSKDDEFFRNVLVNDDRVREHPEAQEIVAAYERSLKRPQARGLKAAMLQKKRQFPLVSPAGIWHGHGTVLKTDFIRESRVLTRIVQGLYYHEFQTPHPQGNKITVYSSNTMNKADEAQNVLLELIACIKEEDKKKIGNEVFSYGFAIAEDNPAATFWMLGFFNRIPYSVYSVPQNAGKK